MSSAYDGSDEAATALSDEEAEGLIPSYITLRSELNEAEQANILDAVQWASSRSRDVLDEKFLRTLHQRMFGDVWQWAGRYRRRGKNIGVDVSCIAIELRSLLDDVRYWIENETYAADEIAARFHHKLVSIHLFPNGNGRHARLATDLLLAEMGQSAFSWGRSNLTDLNESRKAYVAALRAADNCQFAALLGFVRS